MSSIEGTLKEIYYDPKQGYISADKLYEKAIKKDTRITRDIVTNWLANQKVSQVFDGKIRKAPKMVISGSPGHFQADLTFLSQFAKRNSNHGIILVVINVHSKYAYARALKKKTSREVADALRSIIEEASEDGNPIATLQMDNGSEFVNRPVSDLLNDNGIMQMFCQSEDKKCLGIAERFNRTLKGKINKWMDANNDPRWLEHLDDFIENYNSTKHSSIGMSPEKVTMEKIIELAHEKNEHNRAARQRQVEIKIGDKVRIPLRKSVFQKEGKKFSDEVHTVEKVNLKSVVVDGRNKKYPIDEVLLVQQDTNDTTSSEEVEKSKKEARLERILRREGLL